MKTKSFYLTVAALMAIGTASARNDVQNDVILLDLSKATTPLTFNEENGMWEGTYDDDETEIESQVFSIVKNSMGDYNTWWGITASNASNNAYQANTILYQFNNMAKGGILLNEDGSIKLNKFGAPETGKEMPYLVGFTMSGFPNAEITFNTGKSYEVLGAYVNLNSYTFYTILYGDSFARAFTEGDDLQLVVNGIDEEGNEKTLEISLASFTNGSLTASTGWKYVDLSELGVVEELNFTMKSTDTGAYGMNTPAYFCLDKLSVREAKNSSVISQTGIAKNNISYDRDSKTIRLENKGFAAVYDTFGNMVMSSSDADSFSVSDLPAGIYVVKTGSNRLKFAR